MILPGLFLAAAVRCGDVPMIVQRDADDCAPAAVSRVLAFYGRTARVTSADLGTRPGWGTMPQALFPALERLARREGLLFAISLDRPQVDEPHLTPARLAAVADTRPARAGTVTTCAAFRRFVREKAAARVPILQGVTLGIVPEPSGRQTYGGHLRLLIGFDAATDEVIYSDSWGPGHETKRLPLADAWAITDFLLTLEPPKPKRKLQNLHAPALRKRGRLDTAAAVLLPYLTVGV